MIPLLAELKDWLASEGLHQLHPTDTRLLSGPFQGDNGQWRLHVWAPERERIVFISALNILVPQRRRPAMGELLHRINRLSTFGAFDLDYDDGEIRFRTTALPRGSEDLTPFLLSALLTNVVAMDRYLPSIEAVLFGRLSPGEALASLDQEVSPLLGGEGRGEDGEDGKDGDPLRTESEGDR